jgi:hypothetical protein
VTPSMDIIVIELSLTRGFPLEEAREHCFYNQSAIFLLFLYHFSVIVVIVPVILLLFYHF